jgi:hypothetical protein
MSDSRKTTLWALSGLLFCAGARAIVADSANPYQGIVDRNVFGLKPAPPPQKSDPNEKPPAPKVTLNGITTILGRPRAFMSIQMPAKPPEPSKAQTFMLQPGQRDGDIEVLDINEKLEGGTVKVSTFGTVQTLTMDKDGAKLPAGAPVAPTPGMPNPVAFAPQPGLATPAATHSSFDSGLKPLPIRQLRVPESTSANPAASSSPAPGLTTPTFAQAQPPGQAQTPPREISGEEGALNFMTQHIYNTDRGIEMPPPPPPISELLNEPVNQQPPGGGGPPAPGNNNSPANQLPPRAPSLPPLLPKP